jgi:hypothetical protein
METPSFSNSDNVSLTEEQLECPSEDEQKREEKNDVATQTESNPDTPLQYLSNRVFQMEHLLRMVYARVRNTEMITKRNISVILDQNDRHFDKMMDGFRAIQRCWDLSADAQMQIGEAVDQFKQLTGVL